VLDFLSRHQPQE